jgi:dienelactone hydrolase
MAKDATVDSVSIPVGEVTCEGDLRMPERAGGLVIFAHGSGSSRFSSRNRAVAAVLQEAGFGTLLLDLLTIAEAAADHVTRKYRFDTEMLGRRVVGAADWAHGRGDLAQLPIALFGASTGAAAALIAAAERPTLIRAVISRGGRPDLAGAALARVKAPTLLIVGGHDEAVIDLNREAMDQMKAPVHLEIVPGATHLFEEPGTLEAVSRHAADWCRRYLHSYPAEALDGVAPGES